MKKYINSIVAFLVIAVFLLQVFNRFSIVVNYALNKEYITKTFCENKAKPIMKCNGKCHLKKQLEKQEKKEKPTSNSSKEKFEIQYFAETKIELDIQLAFYEAREFRSFYDSNLLIKEVGSVFQPPQV